MLQANICAADMTLCDSRKARWPIVCGPNTVHELYSEHRDVEWLYLAGSTSYAIIFVMNWLKITWLLLKMQKYSKKHTGLYIDLCVPVKLNAYLRHI